MIADEMRVNVVVIGGIRDGSVQLAVFRESRFD